MTDRAIIANADSRRLPLGDGSVHMIATSPPYWGLRDYGTAKWEGGDPECDHAPDKRGSRFATPVSSKRASNAGSGTASERDCRCGAKRIDNQLGLERVHDCLAWARGDEPCGACYVCHLREWAREMWRVLRDDGVMFLNLGDSYQSSNSPQVTQTKDVGLSRAGVDKRPPRVPGLKPKDLVGIPWRVALALQADGWYLRSDIIWAKPNPMPESVTDRPTKSHEYIFLLTKSARYFWDGEAVKEGAIKGYGGSTFEKGKTARARAALSPVGTLPRENLDGASGRNLRSVWNVATQPYSGAHFATWPEALVETMVKAGTPERGVCPVCGKPWERVVRKGAAVNRPDNPNDVLPYTANGSTSHGTGATTLHKARVVETTGWQAGCSHDAAPVPAIVLDPFAGSGTTLLVARRLGRIGLGFDLSLTYLRECAAERLGHNLLRQWGRGIRDNGNHATLPLFDSPSSRHLPVPE